MEEEQGKVANLYFMALEDDIELPSTSHSSFDNDCDNDDDETSVVSKLMVK